MVEESVTKLNSGSNTEKDDGCRYYTISKPIGDIDKIMP